MSTSNATSPAVVQAFKARATLLELLRARGYDTTPYDGSSMSEIHAMLQARQMDMLLTNPATNRKTYVKFNMGKALRAPNLYDWVEDLYHLEGTLGPDDDLIVVAKDNPNDSIQKVLRELWSRDKIFITVIGEEHLQFNIMKHVLVPPHRVLSDEESRKVADRYKITTPTQVPDISRFSPVAAAIGLRPGEWCEIQRKSRTAIKSLFYRICSP